ncbi:MAG: DUF1353 domain-containing protein [Rubricoccaceae bacterium]|nr:DUF1353 domain-containing protein [Rubricoccaceae bacterium]
MRRIFFLILAVCVCCPACGQEDPETDSDSTVTFEYNVQLPPVELQDEDAELFGTMLMEETTQQDIPERAYLVDFAHGRYWMLWQPLTYRIKDSGLSITVPAGFVTDLVSTPRAVWTIIPPTGRYQRAAIIHDWLYWMQPCTRAQSDRIMVLAMEELGVGATTRRLIYESLERFGEDAWITNQEARRDGLPRVVPDALQNDVPDDVAWPDYRAQLAAQGVSPLARESATPAFCSLGN